MSSELLPKMKILLFPREADEQMKHLELLLTIFFWQHLAKEAMNLRGKLMSLGTLSIDNEMHDDDVRNPRRIGSRVSFLVAKRKVKQCVVNLEETATFGSPTSCSRYGFQKRQKCASN